MANEPTRDELQQVHDRLRYALFGLHDAISFAITASEADAARIGICSPDGKSEEGAAIPATQVVERCISGVSGNLVGAGLYTESLCDLLFTCGPAFRRARLQIAATGDETAIFVDGSGESHPSYHDAVFGLINAIAVDLLLTDAGVITEYRLPDEWQTKPDFLSRAGVWYQRIESLASKNVF
ncbi:MAG: hypothetical protein CMJ58_10335 [Planctomycetaceae bacterium]|nr:hypothetical protein [Planctomycetaceae bacterium]